MNVVGHNIAAVKQASSHVFAVAWVTLDHLVVRLEAGHGDLLDGIGLVGCLGGRDDRGVGDQREMNAWVRDKISLELIEIHVE